MPIPIEHLVAKGTAISVQLGRVGDAFKRVFTDPVREWLFQMPAQRTELFSGLLKPRLQISKPKPVLDDHRILEDLRDLVHAGGVTAQELKTLLLNGALELAVPEMVAELTAPRMNKAVSAYQIAVVNKPGFSVRWDVAGGEEGKTRVAAAVSDFAGVPALVDAAAADALSPENLAALR